MNQTGRQLMSRSQVGKPNQVLLQEGSPIVSPPIFQIAFDEFHKGGSEERLAGRGEEGSQIDQGRLPPGLFAGVLKGRDEFQQAVVFAAAEAPDINGPTEPRRRQGTSPR